jgi:hypothetical protein
MTKTLLGAIVATTLTAGSAYAHHSYGAYFEDQSVSIEGTLESIRFANPHVVLTIRTDDALTYVAEWQNLIQLGHAHVTATSLKAGDHIIVTGAPPRDASIKKITLLKEIRRPSDGWQWRRGTSTSPGTSGFATREP